MGVRNYLIDGVSGVGKTTVAAELERRGHHVVHGDRVLAYYGDPKTGRPQDFPDNLTDAAFMVWGNTHWIWPVEKVRAIAADKSHAATFFCGGSRNSNQFIDIFDKVFILEIDVDTLKKRLADRPEDEFGGKPAEADLVVHLHATREGIPSAGNPVDSTMPPERAMDYILAQCGLP